MEVNQIIKHLKYHYSINNVENLTAKKQNGKRVFLNSYKPSLHSADSAQSIIIYPKSKSGGQICSLWRQCSFSYLV